MTKEQSEKMAKLLVKAEVIRRLREALSEVHTFGDYGTRESCEKAIEAAIVAVMEAK